MRAWREGGCAGWAERPAQGRPGKGRGRVLDVTLERLLKSGGGGRKGTGAGETDTPLGSVEEGDGAVHGVAVRGGAPEGGEGSFPLQYHLLCVPSLRLTWHWQ